MPAVRSGHGPGRVHASPPRTDIRVVGEAGLSAIRVGLDQMERAGFISAHDKVVGEALAWVCAEAR